MAVAPEDRDQRIVTVRIAFLGNPGYGDLILEELLRSNVEVVAVFSTTQRFWPRVRKRYRRYFTSRKKLFDGVQRLRERVDSVFDEQEPREQFGRDLIAVARGHGIRTFDGSDVVNSACHDELRRLGVDLILVATFGEFLPIAMLRIPKLAAINMHPSLLPKYRGGFPEFAALLNGEREAGITFHLMETKFDTGNILLQRRLQILEHETTIGLKRRLAALARDTVPELLDLVRTNDLGGNPQDAAAATYCKLPTRFDCITPAMTVRQIQHLIDACHDVEDIGRPHIQIGNSRIDALSYGPAGWPFTAVDGTIHFDRVRHQHKIVAGNQLRALARRLGIEGAT